MTREDWKALSPEEQNNKVIEHMGNHQDDQGRWIDNATGYFNTYLSEKSYLTDLNAMHEAEKMLEDAELFRDSTDYGYKLLEICGGFDKDDCFLYIVDATAAQRAEAFVLTMEGCNEQ